MMDSKRVAQVIAEELGTRSLFFLAIIEARGDEHEVHIVSTIEFSRGAHSSS